MLRGHEAGTCCSDSFPRVACQFQFCEKVLLWGQNFVPAAAPHNITHTALQTVHATTHVYASICFVYTSLHTVHATCVLCVHTKRLVPASRPRNMSPSVYRPLTAFE